MLQQPHLRISALNNTVVLRRPRSGLDERLNANVPAFREALDKAEVRYELHMYESANHAFHNDTLEARYSADAAKLAWQRTVDFRKKELG